MLSLLPRRSALLVACLTCLCVGKSRAAEPARQGTALTETELAARIDQLIGARLKEEKVSPAPVTDDAAFIRRVYLDLAGRIPNILEVRDFLDDDRPDKRRIWVDQLLRGLRKGDHNDTYTDHFAAVWRNQLLPNADSEQGIYLVYSFETWLRKQIHDNVPYDQLVRNIITGASAGGDASAQAFYQANENKPENLAAATARLFLGVKLECAQCHHDRSGGNWSRNDFWQFAAFFADVTGMPSRNDKGEPQITIPNINRTVTARYLGGGKPTIEPGESPRVTLAKWLTSPENAHFSRAAANRVWAYLFGTGLVEPVDERGDHNPPSHAELLDDLARQFALNKFDLKYLLRAIVLSQTYQRSSATTQAGQDDLRLFARAAVRGLSPEQIFDSLAEATEYKQNAPDTPPQQFGDGRRTPRQQFIDRFANHDKRTEAQTTILQALHLMNGSFMARATSLDQNKTLATIADASRIDTTRRLETLYLVALTRKPTEAELKRLVPYVEKGGPSRNPRKALADVFWALLNSSEFILNH